MTHIWMSLGHNWLIRIEAWMYWSIFCGWYFMCIRVWFSFTSLQSTCQQLNQGCTFNHWCLIMCLFRFLERHILVNLIDYVDIYSRWPSACPFICNMTPVCRELRFHVNYFWWLTAIGRQNGMELTRYSFMIFFAKHFSPIRRHSKWRTRCRDISRHYKQ